MAKVVRKKKKRRHGGAGPPSEKSSLRPRFVEKTPPCEVGACPNEVDIRTMLRTIADGRKLGRSFEDACETAWRAITTKNPMPAICGRICLHPCENKCNRKHLEGAVGINSIEKFLGDFGIEKGLKLAKTDGEERQEKIAVVGSGPAALSCSCQLARIGYPVTVFESGPQSGGKLRNDTPDDKLSKDVLEAEINRILELGIELKLNAAIGQDVSLENLKNDYKAIFIEMAADSAAAQKLGLEIEAEKDGGTGREGIFAGSDKGLVSTALARGRRAAASINSFLNGKEPPAAEEMPIASHDKMKLELYERIERFDGENPLTEDVIVREAGRCMSCGYCFDCEKCFMYCPMSAFRKPANKGELYSIRLEVCDGCGNCVEQCPCGFLEMA